MFFSPCFFRLSSLQEVHRRHQSDADRAADDLIHSQAEIEKLETCIPDLSERHKFYQELRGYVTDLVECYNEKVGQLIDSTNFLFFAIVQYFFWKQFSYFELFFFYQYILSTSAASDDLTKTIL